MVRIMFQTISTKWFGQCSRQSALNGSDNVPDNQYWMARTMFQTISTEWFGQCSRQSALNGLNNVPDNQHFFFFFSYAYHLPWLVSHETASSSAECSRDKPPFSFVRGQDSTMWDIVWVSPHGHRSVSVSCHFLLQAPQCPCSVRKRFSTEWFG